MQEEMHAGFVRSELLKRAACEREFRSYCECGYARRSSGRAAQSVPDVKCLGVAEVLLWAVGVPSTELDEE